MHDFSVRVAGVALGMLAFGACSSVVEVTAPELVEVVEADAVAFAPGSIPDELTDRLSQYRVVVVGESHNLREHHEFVADLARTLHERGFRQILLESAQMNDFALDNYVNGGPLLPGWVPPGDLFGALLTSIREFNASRPESDRIRIRCIDANLDDYGGATGFRNLLGITPDAVRDSAPVQSFLQAPHGNASEERAAIRALANSLESDRAGLESSWGESWYTTIAEMVEFEETSIDIRAIRGSNYDLSVRDRETVIKQLADRRIAEVEGGTIINYGDTHAQKKRLFGSKIEWLGDYLVHRSPVVQGDVFVFATIAATAVPMNGTTVVDRLEASPRNEIFRVMHESWPGMTVFLPLDDPLFSRDGIVINMEGDPLTCAPKDHYDGLLVHPIGHRVHPD